MDAVGRPIDGKGRESEEEYSVERIAPGIIPRQSVDQPLQTELWLSILGSIGGTRN